MSRETPAAHAERTGHWAYAVLDDECETEVCYTCFARLSRTQEKPE